MLGLAPHTITEPNATKFAQKLRDKNKWAHKKTEANQAREAERHKRNFDKKSKAVALEIGDMVLVRVTAFKGRHKMQNRWENSEYVVEKWPYPDLPVYVVCPRVGKGAAEACIGTIYFPSVLTWGRMRRASLKIESKMTPLQLQHHLWTAVLRVVQNSLLQLGMAFGPPGGSFPGGIKILGC